jgi:hypothetical protein
VEGRVVNLQEELSLGKRKLIVLFDSPKMTS